VTEPEPLPRDHKLLSNKKVTFTPHFGSATMETRTKMTQMSIENLKLGLQGMELPWKV
jgi:glyoxylate reductase